MSPSQEYFAQTRQELLLAANAWKPLQKVLVVMASHRGVRGVTGTMGRALARGMEKAGAEVQTVALADLEFSACQGCFKCWGPGNGRCHLEDDLTPIIESIPSLDLMLWCLPLYVDGMPGLLKNLVDRMMVLNHPAILQHKGRCLHPCRHSSMPFMAVAAACGFWGVENFEPLVVHLEALALDQHTPLLAFLPRPDSLSLMLPQAREAMVGVELALVMAGMQIIENGSVAAVLADKIAMPLLPRSRYMKFGENWWKGRE